MMENLVGHVYVILLAGHVSNWLWLRSRSGAVLFDLGRPGRTYSHLVLGAGAALFGAIVLIRSLLGPGSTVVDWSPNLMILSVGLYLIIIGLGGLQGLQFREVGILNSDRLVRWNRVESWVWTETDKDLTLQVVGKGRIRFFIWSTVKWKIPDRHKAVRCGANPVREH